MPLLAMFVSDIFLGFAEIWVSLSVYFSFFLISIISQYLRKYPNFFNVIGNFIKNPLLNFGLEVVLNLEKII